MKLDLFIFHLALIFLPGVVWARLDANWSQRARPSEAEFLIRAFLFGVASYVVTFAFYAAFDAPFAFPDPEKPAQISRELVSQIVDATVVGTVLGLAWLYSVNYKWMARFLQWIKATKRFGDEDVWDFTFNASSVSNRYVHFRDFDQKVVYSGDVNTFSETGQLRELVLRDVSVHDFDGNHMYDVPFLYLARKPEGMHIEFPIANEEQANGQGTV